MNQIEHVKDILKRRIQRRNPLPRTLAELEQDARDEWAYITHETFQNLPREMQRKIQTVIVARGANTRY